MRAAIDAIRRAGTSLVVRNYRLYLTGQMISMVGTWMQSIGQAWLVLKLTGSGTALGLVTALQFLPVLILGPVGGLVADRFPKRRVLYVTQTVACLLALTLGILIATGAVRLWMVYVLAAALGLVSTFDLPTRQTFVLELVGPDLLTNAISLNSVMVNLARVLGPAVAGVLVAAVGLSTCFLLNAASYIAVLAALFLMDESQLLPSTRTPRAKGQVREGLRYVRGERGLLAPLLMMAVIGTLSFEFQVTLPLLAKYTFDGGAGTYSAMSSLMGAGAVVGGLLTAMSHPRAPTALARSAVVFGVTILAVAFAPSLPVAFAALALMGAASIIFTALGTTTVQLLCAPQMRGRVMALWTVAFVGSTPIGGPITGWVAQNVGARWGLAIGGIAAVAAGLLAWPTLASVGRSAGRDHDDVAFDRSAGPLGISTAPSTA